MVYIIKLKKRRWKQQAQHVVLYLTELPKPKSRAGLEPATTSLSAKYHIATAFHLLIRSGATSSRTANENYNLEVSPLYGTPYVNFRSFFVF